MTMKRYIFQTTSSLIVPQAMRLKMFDEDIIIPKTFKVPVMKNMMTVLLLSNLIIASMILCYCVLKQQ